MVNILLPLSGYKFPNVKKKIVLTAEAGNNTRDGSFCDNQKINISGWENCYSKKTHKDSILKDTYIKVNNRENYV